MIGSRGFGINEMIIIAIDKTMINCASMVKINLKMGWENES